MADTEKIINAVQIIHEKILAPVIYMCEDEHKIEFVCFCGAKTSRDDFFDAGEKLCEIFSVPVEVVDILEYDAEDSMEIIDSAQLVFSEDPIIARIFEVGLAEDLKRSRMELSDMIKRKTETGTYYLQ